MVMPAASARALTRRRSSSVQRSWKPRRGPLCGAAMHAAKHDAAPNPWYLVPPACRPPGTGDFAAVTSLGVPLGQTAAVALFLTPLEVTAGVGAVTSTLAFAGAMLALAQKARNDRRDAWWKRAQWAIDKSLSDDEPTRFVGTEAMQVLAADPRATTADLDVLDAALVRALDRS